MRRRTGLRIFSAAALGSLVLMTGIAPALADSTQVPRNVQVTDVGHTTATVEWDPPGGHSGNWYRVELSRGGDRNIGYVNGTSYTFDRLDAGETYQVRVDYSDPVEFTTKDVIPRTPTNVQASTAPGTVTVEWDPSIRDGEEADFYVVRWTPDSDGSRVSGTSITREIPSGAELNLTVAARYDGFYRESEPSQPLEVTVPPAEDWEALSAPTNFRLNTDGGVVESFEWDAAEGGADPVTYTLNYRFGSEDPGTSTLIAKAGTATRIDASDITPTDLLVCGPDARPGQKWIIWVTAHSSGKTSPPSNTGELCIS